jgi:hypothetical protein
MMAASLAAAILGALATASSICFGMVRAQRETVASNILLQERLEQLRAGGWAQITNVTALRDQVLARPSTQEPLLPGLQQQITVSAFPSVAGAPLQVQKLPNGTSSITSAGISLANRLAVRVDLRVQWTSRQNRRPRSREISTVVSVGGLLK